MSKQERFHSGAASGVIIVVVFVMLFQSAISLSKVGSLASEFSSASKYMHWCIFICKIMLIFQKSHAESI